LLEIVERYEEDLTYAASPHPPIHAVLSVGNAIFFSGHTALAVLGAIEAAYFGPLWLAVPAVISYFLCGELCQAVLMPGRSGHFQTVTSQRPTGLPGPAKGIQVGTPSPA
jgi:hypothetical protein